MKSLIRKARFRRILMPQKRPISADDPVGIQKLEFFDVFSPSDAVDDGEQARFSQGRKYAVPSVSPVVNPLPRLRSKRSRPSGSSVFERRSDDRQKSMMRHRQECLRSERVAFDKFQFERQYDWPRVENADPGAPSVCAIEFGKIAIAQASSAIDRQRLGRRNFHYVAKFLEGGSSYRLDRDASGFADRHAATLNEAAAADMSVIVRAGAYERQRAKSSRNDFNVRQNNFRGIPPPIRSRFAQVARSENHARSAAGSMSRLAPL